MVCKTIKCQPELLVKIDHHIKTWDPPTTKQMNKHQFEQATGQIAVGWRDWIQSCHLFVPNCSRVLIKDHWIGEKNFKFSPGIF